MFFERAQLHCAVILGGGPIFFLAAHAMPLIRSNFRTEALEEEDLPLLQGVTPAGHTCDLGLSAFADDFAKKIVARSEKELFEALKHSDEVLGKGTRHRCWSSTVGRAVHVEWQQSGGTALLKEGGSHCMAVYGQILDGEGTLGQETHHFGLQGPLANSTCIGGSGSEEICMAPGDAARRDESCSTVGGDFLVGFWAKTCWRRMEDCVREQTRLRLPSIGTFFFFFF